jgi:addiction module HigA family antidote
LSPGSYAILARKPVLKDLQPLGISQVAFARHVHVPVQRINVTVRGKRGVTPETTWLFAQAFGTSPEFGLNLDLPVRSPSAATVD